MTLPSIAQNPRDPDFVQDPYPLYDRARTLGPLFAWEDYGFACSASYATVSALLRDRRFGREAPPGILPPVPEHLKPFYDIDRASMLEREPPDHTRLRSQTLRAFTSRRIAGLEPDIRELAHSLIDRFAPVTDLLTAYAEPIPVTIITRLLGVPDEMGPHFLAWSHDMVAMYQARRDRAIEDRAVAATLAFSDYLQRFIDQRRRAPREDLISALIAAHEGERLSDTELVSTCILLLNAGHEATVHAIGNGVKAILESGHAPADLFASAAATQLATEEILRFDGPLHLFTRYALEPVELAGHRFETGDKVGLLLAAANRDPAKYRSPGRFDPARGATGHLAFGAGLHFCIGAPLARLEMNIALPVLFERLPGLALAEPPLFADRYHFHGLERLRVRIG